MCTICGELASAVLEFGGQEGGGAGRGRCAHARDPPDPGGHALSERRGGRRAAATTGTRESRPSGAATQNRPAPWKSRQDATAL
jgi:hypothetical protein